MKKGLNEMGNTEIFAEVTRLRARVAELEYFVRAVATSCGGLHSERARELVRLDSVSDAEEYDHGGDPIFAPILPYEGGDAGPPRTSDASTDPTREELDFIVSYLGHNDQDANHAWMVRRIRAVLAGKDPSAVRGWSSYDGVRSPRVFRPTEAQSNFKNEAGSGSDAVLSRVSDVLRSSLGIEEGVDFDRVAAVRQLAQHTTSACSNCGATGGHYFPCADDPEAHKAVLNEATDTIIRGDAYQSARRTFNNDDPNDGTFKRFQCVCGTCIEVTPTWRQICGNASWVEKFCSEACSQRTTEDCLYCEGVEGQHTVRACQGIPRDNPRPVESPSEAFISGYNAGRYAGETKQPYDAREAWATYRKNGGSPIDSPRDCIQCECRPAKHCDDCLGEEHDMGAIFAAEGLKSLVRELLAVMAEGAIVEVGQLCFDLKEKLQAMVDAGSAGGAIVPSREESNP